MGLCNVPTSQSVTKLKDTSSAKIFVFKINLFAPYNSFPILFSLALPSPTPINRFVFALKLSFLNNVVVILSLFFINSTHYII